MIVVNVTHEAVEKIGGIGAVIAGMMATDAYTEKVSRTILLAPLLRTDRPANRRVGVGGQVLYSSLDGLAEPQWRKKFRPIEKTYDVGVIYGKRLIAEPWGGHQSEAEIILLDVFHANRDRLNLFKAELYKKFAVPSDRFESTWEYEQYIRLAEPGFEALKAIGAIGDAEPAVLLGHEYMGLPTALKVLISGPTNTRTVFYAHEVASIRPIVEDSSGHDTMFYNVMQAGQEQGKTVEQIFPSVFKSFKHPLVKAGRYCDHVFAVGDMIARELRFLDPHYRTVDIDLVYNGIPSMDVTVDRKRAGRNRMKQYAENLFGFRPDWVFTHVCRPVVSKGAWRDLRVLHELEPMLAARGESAVLFMLGTLAGQRRSQDIRHMERVYGWPVTHERGYPDLCGGEEVVGEYFEKLNREHESIRAVLVNQWDWSRQVCGDRMPEDMTFADIRCGTDVEFGLSIYEPFGISQFEPLCCGGLCVVSNVCGCMGFARKLAEAGEDIEANIIEANFLDTGEQLSIEQLLTLPQRRRDEIEITESRRLAGVIDQKLPRDEAASGRLIRSGAKLAAKMSWENVVRDYFLPALSRAADF